MFNVQRLILLQNIWIQFKATNVGYRATDASRKEWAPGAEFQRSACGGDCNADHFELGPIDINEIIFDGKCVVRRSLNASMRHEGAHEMGGPK